eukprot:GHVH01006523.1.p1 GENE.GHVH01006523.1~~GHVH01006523.1.p1  ORF type:complete len:2629 (+),score=393.78 GHVH01006523.1:106-7992(+)
MAKSFSQWLKEAPNVPNARKHTPASFDSSPKLQEDVTPHSGEATPKPFPPPHLRGDAGDEVHRMSRVIMGACHLVGELVPITKLSSVVRSFPLASLLSGATATDVPLRGVPSSTEELDQWLSALPADFLTSPWCSHFLLWEAEVQAEQWGWLTMVGHSVKMSKHTPLYWRSYRLSASTLPDLVDATEPRYSPTWSHEAPGDERGWLPPRHPLTSVASASDLRRLPTGRAPRYLQPAPLLMRSMGAVDRKMHDGRLWSPPALGEDSPMEGNFSNHSKVPRIARSSTTHLVSTVGRVPELSARRPSEWIFVSSEWAVSLLRRLYAAVPLIRSKSSAQRRKNKMARIQKASENPMLPAESPFLDSHIPAVIHVTMKPSAIFKFLLTDYLIRYPMSDAFRSGPKERHMWKSAILCSMGSGFSVRLVLLVPFGYPTTPLQMESFAVEGLDEDADMKSMIEEMLKPAIDGFFKKQKQEAADETSRKTPGPDKENYIAAHQYSRASTYVEDIVRRVQGRSFHEKPRIENILASLKSVKKDQSRNRSQPQLQRPVNLDDLHPIPDSSSRSVRKSAYRSWLGLTYSLYPFVFSAELSKFKTGTVFPTAPALPPKSNVHPLRTAAAFANSSVTSGLPFAQTDSSAGGSLSCKFGITSFGGIMLSPQLLPVLDHMMPLMCLLPTSSPSTWWSQMGELIFGVMMLVSSHQLLNLDGSLARKNPLGMFRIRTDVISRPLQRLMTALSIRSHSARLAVLRSQKLQTLSTLSNSIQTNHEYQNNLPSSVVDPDSTSFCMTCAGCSGRGLVGKPLCHQLHVVLCFIAGVESSNRLSSIRSMEMNDDQTLFYNHFKKMADCVNHDDIRRLHLDNTRLARVADFGTCQAGFNANRDIAVNQAKTATTGNDHNQFYDNYQPVRFLGAGGFGTVILCKRKNVKLHVDDEDESNPRAASVQHLRAGAHSSRQHRSSNSGSQHALTADDGYIAVKIVPLTENDAYNRMLKREVESLAKTNLPYVTKYFSSWIESHNLDYLYSRLADSIAQELQDDLDKDFMATLQFLQESGNPDLSFLPGQVWLLQNYPEKNYITKNGIESSHTDESLIPNPFTTAVSISNFGSFSQFSTFEPHSNRPEESPGYRPFTTHSKSFVNPVSGGLSEDKKFDRQSVLFISMEFVDGLHLGGLMHQIDIFDSIQTKTASQVNNLSHIRSELFKKLLMSLVALQSTSLLHRDLKPENVLIRRSRELTPGHTALSLIQLNSKSDVVHSSLNSPIVDRFSDHHFEMNDDETIVDNCFTTLIDDPTPIVDSFDLVLVDLGLSKKTSASSSPKLSRSSWQQTPPDNPQMSVGLGTFRYSAPEQMREEGSKIAYDSRVDSYSLGVILFDLHASRPFTLMEGVNLNRVFESHRSGPIALPPSYTGRIPEDVLEVVGALTNHDYRRRPCAVELWSSSTSLWSSGESLQADYPSVMSMLEDSFTLSPYKTLFLQAMDQVHVSRPSKGQPLMDRNAICGEIEELLQSLLTSGCSSEVLLQQHLVICLEDIDHSQRWVNLNANGLPMMLRSCNLPELAYAAEVSIPAQAVSKRFCIDAVYSTGVSDDAGRREAEDHAQPASTDGRVYSDRPLHASMVSSIDVHCLNSICLGDDQHILDANWLVERSTKVLSNKITESKRLLSHHLDPDQLFHLDEKVATLLASLIASLRPRILRPPSVVPFDKQQPSSQAKKPAYQEEEDKGFDIEEWNALCDIISPASLRHMDRQAAHNFTATYASLYLAEQLRDVVAMVSKCVFLLTNACGKNMSPVASLNVSFDGSALILLLALEVGKLDQRSVLELRDVLIQRPPDSDLLDLASWAKLAKERTNYKRDYPISVEEIFSAIEGLWSISVRRGVQWRELISYISLALFPLVKRCLVVGSALLADSASKHRPRSSAPSNVSLYAAAFGAKNITLCSHCLAPVVNASGDSSSDLGVDSTTLYPPHKSFHRCRTAEEKDYRLTKFDDVIDIAREVHADLLSHCCWYNESEYGKTIFLDLRAKLFDIPEYSPMPNIGTIHEGLFQNSLDTLVNDSTCWSIPDSVDGDELHSYSRLWRPCFGPPPDQILMILYALCLLWPTFMENLLMFCCAGRAVEDALGFPVPADYTNGVVEETCSASNLEALVKHHLMLNPELIFDLPMGDEEGIDLLPAEFRSNDLTGSDLHRLAVESTHEASTTLFNGQRWGDRGKTSRSTDRHRAHKDKSWLQKHARNELSFTWRQKLFYLMTLNEHPEKTISSNVTFAPVSPVRIIFNRYSKLINYPTRVLTPFGIEWSLWSCLNLANEDRNKTSQFDLSMLCEDQPADLDGTLLLAVGGGATSKVHNLCSKSIPEDAVVADRVRAVVSELSSEARCIAPIPLRQRVGSCVFSLGVEISIDALACHISRLNPGDPLTLAEAEISTSRSISVEKLSKAIPVFSSVRLDSRDGLRGAISFQIGGVRSNVWRCRRLQSPLVLIITPKEMTEAARTGAGQRSLACLGDILKFYLDKIFEVDCCVVDEGASYIKPIKELVLCSNGFVILLRAAQGTPSLDDVNASGQSLAAESSGLGGDHLTSHARHHSSSELAADAALSFGVHGHHTYRLVQGGSEKVHILSNGNEVVERVGELIQISMNERRSR